MDAQGRSPFIVAEVGASHLGTLSVAEALVNAAALAGADAIKLQTWSEMTVADFVIPSGPWEGRQLRELYAECRLPWEWHKVLFEQASAEGLAAFSTPFDEASVDFLETLDCPIYKIASFEITHLSLIRHAAATGKPLIISTGMATYDEIEEALGAASKASKVTLLKCVSAYPAPPEGFNLVTLPFMAQEFDCEAGLSDHTSGSTVAVAATALGATVIEKHVSLDGTGPDGGFAATPVEFEAMVRAVRECAVAVGCVSFGPTEAEKASTILRRSLWITADVAAGQPLTRENLGILRPQGGLPPEHFDAMLGEIATRDVPRGTPATLDLIR